MTPPESSGSSRVTISRSLARCSRLSILRLTPDARGVRHVDEEAAGEGDLRGDPAALGADGLLGDLDRERLTLLENLGDVGNLPAGRHLALADFRRDAGHSSGFAAARIPLRPPAGGLGGLRPYRGGLVRLVVAVIGIRLLVFVGLEEVGGVQEGALFLADIDKGGLDAGQDRLHAAQIDVADHAPLVGAINQQLYEPIVLEDGHPRLALASVDQDLALHATVP